MIQKIGEFLEKFSKGRKAIVAEGGSLHRYRIGDYLDLRNQVFHLASEFPQINFMAYDYDKEILLSCKLIARDLKLKNLELVLADRSNLPFKDSSLDVILQIGSMIPHPLLEKEIEEFRRTLRKGGVIIANFIRGTLKGPEGEIMKIDTFGIIEYFEKYGFSPRLMIPYRNSKAEDATYFFEKK